MFEGMPRQAVDFLKSLKANNNREWFEAHRADYEAHFVEPAMDLIQALAPIAEALDPPHQAVPKVNKSLRRIHRDTRFSKDKTPYHTHMHIVLWTGNHPQSLRRHSSGAFGQSFRFRIGALGLRW